MLNIFEDDSANSFRDMSVVVKNFAIGSQSFKRFYLATLLLKSVKKTFPKRLDQST